MIGRRVILSMVVVCFNAFVLIDAGIGKDVVQKDFSVTKLATFYAALDADRDGILTLEDFHLRGECYIQKNHLDEKGAKRMHEQEVPKVWKTLGFEKATRLGIPITVETLINSYETAKKTPDFEDAMRSFFTQFFDNLRSYTNDKIIAFNDYAAMITCLRPDATSDEMLRESFEKMDDNNDGGVDLEEMLSAGFDFMFGEEETGDGTLFFGKPEL